MDQNAQLLDKKMKRFLLPRPLPYRRGGYPLPYLTLSVPYPHSTFGASILALLAFGVPVPFHLRL